MRRSTRQASGCDEAKAERDERYLRLAFASALA
jgi:hypothetical protein